MPSGWTVPSSSTWAYPPSQPIPELPQKRQNTAAYLWASGGGSGGFGTVLVVPPGLWRTGVVVAGPYFVIQADFFQAGAVVGNIIST